MHLKQLVNKPTLWKAFCAEVQERIDICHKQIEVRTEPHELFKLQGEIKALKGMLQLRDKINGPKEETF